MNMEVANCFIHISSRQKNLKRQHLRSKNRGATSSTNDSTTSVDFVVPGTYYALAADPNAIDDENHKTDVRSPEPPPGLCPGPALGAYITPYPFAISPPQGCLNCTSETFFGVNL